MARVEPFREGLAGATELSKADIKGRIVDFIWKLKREAYSEATIKEYSYILKTLAKRGANLFAPDDVKDVISQQDSWSLGRKSIVVKAYTRFLKTQGLTWQPPRYKPVHKLPFIPTENEVDDLIAGCSTQMATFLQLLKETAARCGEAFNLTWTDIDLINNTVNITPEKGGNPRIVRISGKLAAMLKSLPRTASRVFTYKRKDYLGKTFRKQRKRIAHKLKNPKLLQIHFHTLRHWKATMEYAKPKDILHVMQLLDHKNIRNTLTYTHLVCFKTDEYVSKVSKSIEQDAELIEAGFEYITDREDCKLFRKRK